MRSSLILALTCWVGAAVMGALRFTEREIEPDLVSVSQPVLSKGVVKLKTITKNDTGNHNQNQTVVRIVRMKVTAYCLCGVCCGKWALRQAQGKLERKTSIGDDARIYDGVAADPKLLPYRTRLEIPGIGIKEVDDTGGAMRQDAKRGIYHIDVRMPSHSAARQWGVRWLNVKILN